MKNTELTHEQITYYKAYKDLFILHQKYYGKNYVPNVPALFSEDVCRTLLGLNKIRGKTHDAQLNNKTYEIKATCFPNTKTSFSHNFSSDIIVWICFNPEDDKICIKELNKREILQKIKRRKNKKTRVNVDLAKINSNDLLVYEINCLFQNKNTKK